MVGVAAVALPAFAGEVTVAPGSSLVITVPGGATISVREGEQPPPPPQTTLPILINAGGETFTAGDGQAWISDTITVSGGGTVNRGNIPIDRTEDDYLFQTERWGKANFAIPIAPGRYDVRFHYAETYVSKAGQRNTGALVEGRALDPFDVWVAAGGARKAMTRTVRDVSIDDGILNLSLLGKTPMVNAIEVAAGGSLPADVTYDPPAPPPPPPPGDDQSGGDDTPIPDSAQCDPSTVPGLARDRGMTEFVFCEDFSSPSRINLTSGTLGAGQTFIQNNIFSAQRNPPDRFTFSDGILTLRPINSKYQGHLISTSRDGKGFQLRGGGWYTEARLRHLGDYKTWPGCTAFWSMDSDHLDKNVGKNFLEPDFWEHINGGEITALHYWIDMKSNPRVKKSEQFSHGASFDPKQWFTVGAMVEDDLSAYRWHRNGKVTGSKSPSWMEMFREFNGPIIIGSGSACPIQIDFIRVWKK